MKQFFGQVAVLLSAAIITIFSIQSGHAGGGYADQKRPAIWQGFYAGIHAGGVTGETTLSVINAPDSERLDQGGTLGGVHVGYNFQHENAVFGIEGDYSFSNTEFDTIPIYQDYFASIRGRVGYAMNNTLFFATAGFAWSTLSDDFGDELKLDGYVFGAGVEHKFNNQFSIRGEVLHYTTEGALDQDHAEVENTVFRAGISWHVN